MKKIGIILLVLITSFFTLNAMATQNNGGDSSGVKNTCEISGGTFTGSESGNWACCWADWGCYGCVDGNCKIKCHTRRCRKANGIAASSSTNTTIPGLAPKGMKAPIIPREYLKQ
ncbi:MAG: hypothetical protein SFW66_04530 [Gammaproteobacteria bacterium]|nr:hypothetical protein [Gammaproteobacteria bacterium]